MTAKTIQRLAILIAIVSLIGGAAIWAQQYQLTKMAQSVVTQAQLAEEKGDFTEAERLYQQHLEVVRGDTETKVKYADIISKSDNALKQQAALGLYNKILNRLTGRRDLVRKRMDLEIKMKLFRDAHNDLSILLDVAKDDGELWFLMGQCFEAEGDETSAERSYKAAIENHAPQYLEAYQRLASLLLKKPGGEQEADEQIARMVRAEPTNYKVYLERGRYRKAQAKVVEAETRRSESAQAKAEAEARRSQLLEDAHTNFREAAKRAPNVPEVILALAQSIPAGKSGRSDARQILEKGLKAAPKSAELYEALADLELQDSQVDKAIAVLERGVKAQPDAMHLHMMMANLLAQHGDTGKLLLQIEELKELGLALPYIQYFMAYYYANLHQCEKARQILVALLAEPRWRSILAVPINLLLARCYSELGEPQMQQDAFGRALLSKPGDVTAKLGYIDTQIQQGDLDGAIEGCRELVGRVPEVPLKLVRLLIARNRQRPTAEQDWMEVERLLEDAAKAAPESVAPVILRAEVILARDRTKVEEAREIVREARKRFPKSVELWNAEAHILSGLWDAQVNSVGKQRKVDEALALLNEAERKLGDSVELRMQRARLWAAKTGRQVAPALTGLAQNAVKFSKPDRRKLLEELARELFRRQNYEGASHLLSQLAEDEPNDVRLRSLLVELGIELGNKDEIEKYIAQIKRIEGDDGIQRGYLEVRYLIWQLNQTEDKNIRQKLRTQARASLTEMRSRRPDLALIPHTLAKLDEQELAQVEQELAQKGKKLDEKQKREKQEGIIKSYIEAINLGQHDSDTVRHVVGLLFAQGKAKEALDLFNRIPVESQLVGDLGRKVAQVAIDHQDLEKAEEIARKTVAANPGSLKDRLGLVQILRDRGHQTAAEEELKNFVALGKDDPDRWIALVWWYVVPTKQPEKAELAIKEAEKTLPHASAPMALAQCCKLMGDGYEGMNNDTAQVKWYSEAEKWYEEDRAAHPDDLLVTRRLVEFFIRTKQFEKALSRLKAIVKQNDGKGKNSDMVVWANRERALILASGTDPQGLKEALALVEPHGQVGKPDPDDLRILARVLEAQKTPEHRQRAIKVLQSLVTQSLATGDDRFLLAQLTEASGDWPGARELYRGLISRPDNVRDLETLNRWPGYLFQFARALLRHHQAGNDQDLAEVQDVIGKLKRLQADSFDVLALEVERCRLQNQLDRAAELIANFANRSGLLPPAYSRLAEMAVKLGRPELAERLYKEIVNRWPDLSQGTMLLAEFLGRRGQVKEALDLCEPLWLNTKQPDLLAVVSIRAVFGASDSTVPNSHDPTQVSRVAGWVERALAKNPKSATLPLGLGNIREQQGLYPQAEELYKQAITNGDRGGVSHNNLAWLMTLKDGKATTALEYVNQAIGLKGPTADFLDTRGVIYLAAGDKQRALKDLENAVAIDPAPAKLFHLAQAYLAAHDKEKAKRAFEAAKTKGLVPSKLHRLEEPVYRNVVKELAMK